MSVLDDYLVAPDISLLDKTRIQAVKAVYRTVDMIERCPR